MNIEEFREFGKASVDYIADYLENIRNMNVLSSVEPGYLSNELPEKTPFFGEPWQGVLSDVDRVIVPGLTHWQSPNFHAYFPTANSYPGVVGELFSAGLGCISTDWESNPACVELEVRMMDWLAKMLGLPNHFLNESEGPGGGVIQNAASESTLVGLLSGKQRTIKTILNKNPKLTANEVKEKLIAYTSKESNSSVEKASLLASVPMRLLSTDDNCSLRGKVLQEAINEDRAAGLIPCCVVASLGTTGTCAFDDLEELGKICAKENMWLHVDAAYAGAALVCPEYRYLMKGIEYVDSFNFNPHKWFLVNSDCSAMWFKNTNDVEAAFKLQSSMIKDPTFKPQIEDWQIPTSRRFRALKLWFVMRIYGVEGIQKYIREQVSLAKYLESLVREDDRYELLVSSLGVVCFRLKGDDSLTQLLLDRIAESKKLYIMPYYYHKNFVVRFVICSRLTTTHDIDFAWHEISSIVEEISNGVVTSPTECEKPRNENTPADPLTKAMKGFSTEKKEKFKLGLFL
nr:aromatic-L-amino-acid decarboxylase-like [Leptinotarsa decemlineata]